MDFSKAHNAPRLQIPCPSHGSLHRYLVGYVYATWVEAPQTLTDQDSEVFGSSGLGDDEGSVWKVQVKIWKFRFAEIHFLGTSYARN